MTLLHHALGYAAKGLRVFPLAPGFKVPTAGSAGCSDATTDAATIRRWWRKIPDAGIAVVPGPRYWVLDIDSHPPKVDEHRRRGRELIDGFEALRRIEAAGFVLPETLEATTPRGGRHLWWVAEKPMNPSRYAPMKGALAGLDVRGMRSYVVMPPTVTVDGAYTWTRKMPPVSAPAWLVELMLRTDKKPPGPVKPLPPGISEDMAARRWAEVSLEYACKRIRETATGRHDAWNREAFLIGGIVGASLLDGERARTELEAAAGSTVKGRRAEIRRTIDDGLRAGFSRPVFPERKEGG